ncbi:MAG: cadherin repeat domain-containing protein, partial [Planctomycetales bacterium]|nr:cadherin repeat domain-containing protein [Planctomycetales bacterium]
GYVNGEDHSRDDNWSLGKTSPAIDSAHSWHALSTDAIGSVRLNDPATPDSGSNDYVQLTPVSDPFVSSGTAMDWHAGYPDYTWQYTLPFGFPFFDQTYTTVTISSGGLIQFDGYSSMAWDETAIQRFPDASRITAFWDNLRTDGSDDDIFIDESIADQVTIRWDATHVTDGTDVDFSVTLYSSGEFTFHYGSDVTTSPVAGYANSDLGRAYVSVLDESQTFAANQSIEFVLRPGHVDIGALEFRGSSDDIVAPVVASTFPGEIGQQQSISALIDSIRVLFSEEVNYFDAGSFAAYELREAGANGTFGDGDDVVYQLVPKFQLGDSFVDLQIVFVQGAPAQGPLPESSMPATPVDYLPEGNYQFFIQSDLTGGVRDTAGLLIDGDGNGAAGGAYQREFEIYFLPEFSWLSLSTTINEGGNASLSGEFVDYSSATSHSIQVDWGDGTAVQVYDVPSGQKYFQIDRVYVQDSVSTPSGSYSVTASILNDLGRSSAESDPKSIVVNNVAPALSSLTAPANVNEDEVFTLSGQIVDPGLSDTHTLSIDWGDGTGLQQVVLAIGTRDFAVQHTYSGIASSLTPIDQTITVTLSDGGLPTASSSRLIRLIPANLPPSIENAVMVVLEMADNGTVVGQLINSDPDLVLPNIDSQSFTIVGGSGLGRFAIDNQGVITVANGNALDHEGTASYSLFVEVTDGHGLKDTATITINIGNVPEIESFSIDNGSAQRSVVRSITVKFDSDVTLEPDAFEIQKIGGGVFNPLFTTQLISGKTVATLTFEGHSETGGSLADGNYQLRIVGEKVVAGGTQMRTDATDDFFRLFGDSDGDRDVDGLDYGRLALAFLKSIGQQGFNSAFDFDGDGDVDGRDYGRLEQQFLKTLAE